MTKSISEDLRSRVISAVDGGLSRRAAAERFGVAAASAVRWVREWRETGSTRAKPQGGDMRSRRIEAHRDVILGAIEEPVDITLVELAEMLRSEYGAVFAPSTIWRFLDRHSMTVKKSRARQGAGAARRFVLQAAARLGVTPPKLEARAFRHLEKHDWPGNVRELMRFAENFVLGLGDHDLGASASAGPTDLKSRLDAFETELIEEALGEAAGDVTRACAALGLPRKTFYYRLQKLGIDPASFRG